MQLVSNTQVNLSHPQSLLACNQGNHWYDVVETTNYVFLAVCL